MNKAHTNNPSVDQPIRFGTPFIADVEQYMDLVKEIMESKQLTNGGLLFTRLASELRSFLGVRHCIPVCNGTTGLQMVFRALDLTGEVITTPFTFPATIHALTWLGLKPVFVDVTAENHTIDTEMITKCINRNTSAILGVHIWGFPCQVDRLQEIAERDDIKLIYDAAHAFGNKIEGVSIGNFGDCEVFSFHATKFFQTIEGGAITTNNDALAHKLRLLQNHGIDNKGISGELGTNGKMSEIHAAMGLVNLPKLSRIINKNMKNYMLYKKQLSSVPGIRLLPLENVENCNYQFVVLEVSLENFGIARDEIYEILIKNNIFTKKYFFQSCHTFCSNPINNNKGSYPVTEVLSGRTLILPTGTTIKESDIRSISSLIKDIHYQLKAK